MDERRKRFHEMKSTSSEGAVIIVEMTKKIMKNANEIQTYFFEQADKIEIKKKKERT